MQSMNRGAEAFARAIEGRTHEEVEALLGLARRSGQVTRLASGERKPGRALSYRIQEHLKVPMHLWELPISAKRGRAA